LLLRRGERAFFYLGLNVIIRLEIAASVVKFFGDGENVAFPLEMNFRLEVENIFIFLTFCWRRPSGFNQFH
jgi:hypothetical protein